MAPKRLDEKDVIANKGTVRPYWIMENSQDMPIEVPARCIHDAIKGLKHRYQASITKKKLLEEGKKEAEKQLQTLDQKGNGIRVVQFNPKEYRKMLKELIVHSDNEEGLTRADWEWKRDAIIARFLDATGLTPDSIFPGGRIFTDSPSKDRDGNWSKPKTEVIDVGPSFSVNRWRRTRTDKKYDLLF